MFFFSFFWAFFHSSLCPDVSFQCLWPPYGMGHLIIYPYHLPLLNTMLLLTSGFYVTASHHSFKQYFRLESLSTALNYYRRYTSEGLAGFSNTVTSIVKLKRIGQVSFFDGVNYMAGTIVLAIVFTAVQLYEYSTAQFAISDGVYGSTFYMMTGFHGLHVLVGTIFLIVCLIRIVSNFYVYKPSIGLDCSIWYWHFVDVVWIFLFICVYCWGNTLSPSEDYLYGGEYYFTAMEDPFSGFYLADYAYPAQYFFQDPATYVMEAVVRLHNYIMFYLIVILFIVLDLLLSSMYFQMLSSARYSGSFGE
jgi:heme/copper-type cytochrome/quinol oxidase subunit 3